MSGRHFEHPQCPFFIEFIAPPVAIGSMPVKKFNNIKTKYGVLKLLTIEDIIKDRLAAYYYWNDQQSLDLAVLLYIDHKKEIDLALIKDWLEKEGQIDKFYKYLKLLEKREQI